MKPHSPSDPAKTRTPKRGPAQAQLERAVLGAVRQALTKEVAELTALGALLRERRRRVHRDGRIEGFARLTPDLFALPRGSTRQRGSLGGDPGAVRPRLNLPFSLLLPVTVPAQAAAYADR